MRFIKLGYLLGLFFIAGLYTCSNSGNENDRVEAISAGQDSINTSIVINYLRNNFDDIHDVSMRFHHLDHNLNGLIVLRLKWRDGKLQSGEAVQNETGNEDFAQTLLEKIKKWSIPDLRNEFEMNLPLRIRIVGSDDPSFSTKSIVTGKVVQDNGDPISRAQLKFIPVSNGQDTVTSCYTNREGIFVRTLVPPGTWNVLCSRSGFKNVYLNNVVFISGEHYRQKIIMKRK